MKVFIKKDASTKRKINYHWLDSLKNGEKNGFLLPENQLYTSNHFFLILIMVSTSSGIVLTKKYCFHQAENPFVLAG